MLIEVKITRVCAREKTTSIRASNMKLIEQKDGREENYMYISGP